MNINVNDKVLIVSDDAVYAPYKNKLATVKRIYHEATPPVAFVEIDNLFIFDDLVGLKVPLANLVVIESENSDRESENSDRESDIPEGAREITKEDFEEALMDITSLERGFSEKKVSPVKSFFVKMTSMVLGRKIAEVIFEDQPSIIVTEEQFIEMLWDLCNPVSVSESIDKKMSVRKCVPISQTTIFDLLSLVPVFFGESEK